ncbi:MAG: hypothetical protein J6R82_06955 [Clostridia bacterium]|nr:hypothetical protein [Clostridia bacterium]
MKMKVYIEDHSSFDTIINDIPCRKLGELKNGEVKTFQIGEEAAMVFVIADQISRNYCNDCYNLPAGGEDVSLTGKNCFNPGAGNPFRFDGVADEDILANRKRGGKKGLLVIIAALVVGLVIGVVSNLDFNISTVKDKTFSEGGLSITLTNQFKSEDPGEYVAFYESNTMMVGTFIEPFSLAEGFGDLTIFEYGEGLIKFNEQTAGAGRRLQQDGDLYYFVWDDIFDRRYYTYVTYLYKTDDAFWHVDFIVEKEEYEKHREEISQWAHSVTFDGEEAN